MKKVCETHVQQFYQAGKPASGLQLQNVAQTFGILQEQRLIADYDISFDWLRKNAAGQINLARKAFADWRAIRTEPEAQDLLLLLFLSKLPRQ